MNYFGMVSTRNSMRYTQYALESFFKNTPLSESDRFFLIDNDSSHPPEDFTSFSRCEVIRHEQPIGFASNLNQIMKRAEVEKADLFFLNNDLIFTKEWLTPLLVETPALLSPLSNRELHYVAENFKCEITLELDQYLGYEKNLEQIANHHRNRELPYNDVFFLPFFCIKIPYAVYSVLGPLDESFGKGGGEDNDYCLRAYLSGFKVSYAPRSYILHFSGKSFWAGGENSTSARKREILFRRRFQEKWGERLVRLSINNDSTALDDEPAAKLAAERGDIKGLIEALQGNR